MEKGKGVMGGGRRWAVDFTDSSTSPSSRDIPDPPGFSRASLDQEDSAVSRQKKDAESNWKSQKAWEVAQAPFKNLLMMGFMMWMAGSTSPSPSPLMAMNGAVLVPLHAPSCGLNRRRRTNGKHVNGVARDMGKKEKIRAASFMAWTAEDVVHVAKFHWVPCLFAVALLFFMGVEYTLRMIPPSSAPFDLGFVATSSLHRLLTARPKLNTLLAALNTVFVGMQTTYILWTWLIEGRPRATISALFMFTCRGILGYSTQLPLPQGFLGSGVDFPVGNVSFFLFYSGHVAGSVIASLDMRRTERWELAWTFDVLNVLQAVRLLGTRGHYTIDLAVGVGAGILFDSLAGKYEERAKEKQQLPPSYYDQRGTFEMSKKTMVRNVTCEERGA